MNKKIAQKKHAIRRMGERTSVQMSKKKYKQLCELTVASARRGGVLFKQTVRTRLIRVSFYGEDIIVAYDIIRKTVVTVLPKENEFYKIFNIGQEDNNK